ncbi:MAG: copper chaperone PCu(A)C [Candidatus Rokubacteria bacterium]|nr:copper chaperone PCu(A)C [Candidatus Rokubacteria bacterium]
MRPRRSLVRAVLALALVALAGCVYYPTVMDVGGVRIVPERGRVVRQDPVALFYVDINSTGMFDDVLLRVETPIARRAELLGPSGAPLARLQVPGTTLVRLQPDGQHVVLSELTRELKPGEVVVVTLVFEKSGAIGVISPVE